MHARRALLYMPGDDMHKIQKAIGLGVDSICMDLEDGVALNRKIDARQTILVALSTLDFGQSEKLVRINPVHSNLYEEELEAIIPALPDGIVVPKIQLAEEIQHISEIISRIEKASNIPEGKIKILAIIETAMAIVKLAKICQASSRIQGLIFGAEDLAVELGASRTKEGWEIFYARSAVITHARAFGLDAIDMVYLDFQDQKGLEMEAIQGAKMGYTGKQIIHPNQVEPVQKAFTPSDEEITKSKKIIQAYNEHIKKGVGAFAVDGKLVDAPVVKVARRILERATAAGKLTESLH